MTTRSATDAVAAGVRFSALHSNQSAGLHPAVFSRPSQLGQVDLPADEATQRAQVLPQGMPFLGNAISWAAAAGVLAAMCGAAAPAAAQGLGATSNSVISSAGSSFNFGGSVRAPRNLSQPFGAFRTQQARGALSVRFVGLPACRICSLRNHLQVVLDID